MTFHVLLARLDCVASEAGMQEPSDIGEELLTRIDLLRPTIEGAVDRIGRGNRAVQRSLLKFIACLSD